MVSQKFRWQGEFSKRYQNEASYSKLLGIIITFAIKKLAKEESCFTLPYENQSCQQKILFYDNTDNLEKTLMGLELVIE